MTDEELEFFRYFVFSVFSDNEQSVAMVVFETSSKVEASEIILEGP